MRLASKAAIVVGAGRTLGETIGNGRATTILFAREGARVMLVDRDLESSCEAMAAACAKAMFQTCKHVLPTMREQHSARS